MKREQIMKLFNMHLHSPKVFSAFVFQQAHHYLSPRDGGLLQTNIKQRVKL
jgi:hypothetical protein